jgi:hypothetical protein
MTLKVTRDAGDSWEKITAVMSQISDLKWLLLMPPKIKP